MGGEDEDGAEAFAADFEGVAHGGVEARGGVSAGGTKRSSAASARATKTFNLFVTSMRGQLASA